MSQEILDTSSKYPDKEIPDGTYTFQIKSVSKKSIGDKTGYEWVLEYDGNRAQVLFWPSQMGPLLRVLGVKESEKDKFMFDTMEVEGKVFKGTAFKMEKNGKTYQNLKDFVTAEVKDDSIPF